MTYLKYDHLIHAGLPCGSDGKESAQNAGDPGWIPRSGRSPEKGMATDSSLLARRIPRIEEPGAYSPWDRKESDTTEPPTLSPSFMLDPE